MSHRPLYYDRQGEPIWDTAEWARLHGDIDYKRVAQTTIGDFWVSTVWLGIDHGMSAVYGGKVAPVIFETMIFYQGDRPLEELHAELRDLDQMQWRYCTEAQAIEGHDGVCVDVRTLIANIEMADEIVDEAIERNTTTPDSSKEAP